MREWFPEAFGASSRPLPSAPEFQHHFLGLCNLTDWMALTRIASIKFANRATITWTSLGNALASLLRPLA